MQGALELAGIEAEQAEFETITEIRNTAQRMTIIHALTGYGKIFELFECREAGFEDYFLKPVNLSLLFDVAEGAFKKIDRWFNN